MGRAEETRARLLDATAEVVRDSGYAKATTRAIAARAGLTEGAIYRHFPNKAALFFAALLERNRAVVDRVESLPELAGTGTVKDNLLDLLTTLAEVRDQILPFEEAMRSDAELRHQRDEMFASAAADGVLPGPPGAVAEYLRREQALGRVRRNLDPDRVGQVVLATLAGLSHTPLPDDQFPELLDAAIDLFLVGLTPVDVDDEGRGVTRSS